MQLRDEHGNLILGVGTLDGRRLIGAPSGTVTITIPASTTGGLDFDTGSYDLLLSSTTATRLLQGIVTLSKAMTV